MNFLKQKEVHKVLEVQENDMEEFELKEINPKELLDEQEPNVCLYNNYKNNVVITTGMKWYTRLWYMISNPFRYLFTGKLLY